MARDPVLGQLAREVEVLVEQPRWSFVKRRADGRIDFISPLPCPYNYGCIPGLLAGDGDPLDAVLMGPRLPRGARVTRPVVAIVDFRDAGATDPKVICSASPLSAGERAGLSRFFTLYALAKSALNRARGKSGETRFAGFLSPGSAG